MSDYLSDFEKAVQLSRKLFDERFQPKFNIDKEKEDYDVTKIVESIVEDFSDGVVEHAGALVGSCFLMVREASYVLHEMGIRHCPTIGNVIVDGSPFYSTTVDSIKREVEEGYVPFKSANSHAWLTLDTGQILDLTILSSISARKNEIENLRLSEAFFVSGVHSVNGIIHQPLLSGFGYHFGVVTHMSYDRYAEIYAQWAQDYFFKYHY